ncbi:hypothetical protein AOZ29_002563 [Salmonella enterica subsp. enterica serovar Norwich]|nr:hypothetical protein [Salmonella enterica subsp. enterica serovar Mbandaka]EDR3310072.1 hypothetical protein [Salmonella enterica subsp. enterica serovar Norwich]EDR7513574.1 hypothetical protein [Salmonella enterica subsp. enterica serovar Michigan]EDS6194115.1 hypothetical protein [Salmonella enterica subsp. enterica serovar Java]EDS7052581.1 hypothetical protein [Salmonella enterica subsp. enterica serovar Enteritidis]EDT3176722.1 hypothetical protein [Salmonella enterica subsp. enterica
MTDLSLSLRRGGMRITYPPGRFLHFYAPFCRFPLLNELFFSPHLIAYGDEKLRK